MHQTIVLTISINEFFRRDDYYPPTKPYEMSEVLMDLLEFSARQLRLGGRLVYWLPTIVDE